ncbi:radical SAM/SPASM domain-containing protein [Anaerocolumna xylanovorans]|uniref:Radical SAM additional 4Fe4S-binding SPASM domain-containing protein n=1 Tax=Anaerocolumna xylanovorans DSM 12503 TaxID=1121345 RepID=A0A1M7XZK6_9FIRM|nr:radical SAM/SPASM domain-containing protein [Anaerocolumna xylanovorans]SHO44651.1 radical SAM additional 4Fe4S-binding SPASM domain-containing protein [Anaerocolumna xylanovorans DSM 12503]
MKKFKKIYIEITNICNLACAFCPSATREKAYMSEEDFTDIIREIKPFTDYVYFHVKGEPLLHPKLGVFLDICHSYGMKVNITTNGTLISRALKELEGKEALRQVNFSLHSFGGEKEDKIKYLKDILMASKKLRMTTAANISYRFWNMQPEDEQGTMTERREINPDVINDTEKYLRILEREYGVEGSLKDMVPAGRGIKLAERVYISRDYEFTWPSLAEEEDEGDGFCYGLRTHAGILSDGTVIPCCLDGEGVISLGNIKEGSFGDIINSPRAEAIYEGFSNRRAVEELCRKCGYRKKFGPS